MEKCWLSKETVENEIAKKLSYLKVPPQKGAPRDFVDITLPGRGNLIGSIHPINQVMSEIIEIFNSLGFKMEVGPEIESDYYEHGGLLPYVLRQMISEDQEVH